MQKENSFIERNIFGGIRPQSPLPPKLDASLLIFCYCILEGKIPSNTPLRIDLRSYKKEVAKKI